MWLVKVVQYATILGAVFGGGALYMQAHTFKEAMNPKKHDAELIAFIDDLRKVPEVSPNFNPKIGTEIKDFDFIMNVEFDENKEGRIDNTIRNYKIGQYCLSATPDGKAILKLIEFKLNEVLLNNDMVIKIKARGTADGIPVRSNCYYDGQLGGYLRIKYFRDKKPKEELTAILIAGETIMQNEYFALLRAYDVVNQLKMKYSINPENIKIFVQEFNEQGGIYRRCDLSITVEKAFLNTYNELNPITKFVVDEF